MGNPISSPPHVVLPDGADAPADGATPGEIAFRGDDVMPGYVKDPEATADAVPDGWFCTGDVGVLHPDGYVELRDRSKDVIISGGEDISSVEVERAVAEPPAPIAAARHCSTPPGCSGAASVGRLRQRRSDGQRAIGGGLEGDAIAEPGVPVP